jgi:hypothetical protein
VPGLLRRLHKFFYSDDEIVKLADGLNEFDAGSYEELLRNNGIVAMRKNMEAVYDRYWRPMLFDNFALYVKQSDVDRAIEVLGPLLGNGKLAEEAAEGRRLPRRLRRHRPKR